MKKTTTYEVQDDGRILMTDTLVTQRFLTPEQFQAIKDTRAAIIAAAQDDFALIETTATLSQQKVKPSPVQLDNNIV